MSHTKYIWDFRHDCCLMETDENDVTTAVYTNEPVLHGDLISQRRGDETSYYHFDALGSTERLTDESQTTTDTYVYSAFGEDKGTAGTAVNPFRYVGNRGYCFDGEEFGYWIRERRYAPSLCRWHSLDINHLEFGSALHQSGYAYANNSPTLFIDASGEQPDLWNRPPKWNPPPMWRTPPILIIPDDNPYLPPENQPDPNDPKIRPIVVRPRPYKPPTERPPEKTSRPKPNPRERHEPIGKPPFVPPHGPESLPPVDPNKICEPTRPR